LPVKAEVLGAVGWAVEFEGSTAFENPIDDHVGEVMVMQNVSPLVGGFIRA
jgi:hypothetical protein